MESLANAMKGIESSFETVPAYKRAKQKLSGLNDEEMKTYIKMREAKVDQEAYQKLKASEHKKFETWSIWGGGGRQKFDFDHWDPNQQDNVAKAEKLKLKA